MKNHAKTGLILSLCCGLLLLAGPVMAAAAAELTIDSDQIAVGEAAQLTITIHGSTAADRPRLNPPGGLSIESAGTSNQIQLINGAFSSQLCFNYSVVALKPGQYTIGPFDIKAGNKTLHTNSLVLTVSGSAAGNNHSQPAGPDEEQDDTDSRQLSLMLDMPKTTLYQGETVPVTIKLLVAGISVEGVSYPSLGQSEFVLGKMAEPVKTQEVVNGIAYKALEFHTTLTPVKTGNIALGPAAINCNIVVRGRESDSFFGDVFPSLERRSVQIKSKKIPIRILPLPAAGKPADFSGGIGQFQLKVSASPGAVTQGDPVTVKMALSGKGNIQVVNAPVLKNQDGFKVYDTQRKSVNAQDGNSGAVSFEQVLIPVDGKIKQIASYHFSYFDPAKGFYQQITAPPIPLAVKANPDFNNGIVSDHPDRGQQLGRDLVFIKNSPGNLRLAKERLYYQVWFWILQLLPLIGLFITLYYHHYIKMLQSDTPEARSLRAGNRAQTQLDKAKDKLNSGKTDELLEELHSIIRTYLAQKYNLAAAGMTVDVVESLKNEGIDANVLQQIGDFFTKYDFYRFTGAGISSDDAGQMLQNIAHIIDELNKKANGKSNRRLWAGKEPNIRENE
jgi:hypothetical protein